MLIPKVQNVVNKPVLESWMECPNIQVEYPGLAFIAPLDNLIVAKKRDALHDIIGETGIAYTIFNSGGQKVFLAVLEKRYRNFNVKIFNNYGNEVINVKRSLTLCTNRVFVWAPPGNYAGCVQSSKCCRKTFYVRNRTGKNVLKINGGMFRCVYKIFIYGGRHVGLIQQFPAAFLDVKNFGVTFPAEFDVRDKAVLLGAVFLLVV